MLIAQSSYLVLASVEVLSSVLLQLLLRPSRHHRSFEAKFLCFLPKRYLKATHRVKINGRLIAVKYKNIKISLFIHCAGLTYFDFTKFNGTLVTYRRSLPGNRCTLVLTIMVETNRKQKHRLHNLTVREKKLYEKNCINTRKVIGP